MNSLFKLRTFLRPYWSRIVITLILLLGITGLNLIVPAIIRLVIDVGLMQREMRTITIAALVILIIGIIRAVLTYLHRYNSEWVAQHVGYSLRNRLYDHIQNLPFSYHDRAQTGQLISRCIEDVRAIERFTGHGVIDLIRLSLLLVGIIALLFYYNAKLAPIALLPMMPLMLITTNFGRRIGDLFLAVDHALGELSSRLQESVTGVQVVRAFAREPYEIENFDQANRNLYNARLTIIGEWSKVMPSTLFLVTLGTILILWFGGNMVLRGEMTIGELVAFNSYLLMLASPAQQLTWLVNLAGEAEAGIRRSYEVLDVTPEIQSPPDAIVLPPLSGEVEFRDIEFHYGGENKLALQDINLKVEPNQVIALIGSTGSGKTTLVNLIPRFYDVSKGSVRVDGYDVRQVELTSLRRQIGIVLQTSTLFSTTIRENIAYGKPDASLDDIISSAQAAQAHEFILSLPQQYETIIGERGVTLSGGQRQRVAIARALLMDPRILILDDSTSSVDIQTELLIQHALDRLMENRTTFVIAHRVATVRRADLILVMDEGRIVEQGKHKELLERGRFYSEIYDLQLRDQERFIEEIQALKENIPLRPSYSLQDDMGANE
jgi:ATP-binding cassette, subfamily B, multidrug efflux pump